MTTAQEFYETMVRQLPPAERLRLDELIQVDIPRGAESHTGSEEDLRDLRAYSLRYAANLYPEDEALV